MIRKQKRKNNKGFSLVELIIVIAIMAILAGILAPQFVKYINKGKISTDIQNAQQIASALSVYYADNGKAIPFTIAKKGDNMPSGSETIESVLGGIPEVKAETGKVFAFEVDSNGNPKVWIVATDASGSEGGNEMYPSQTGTWKQKADSENE